MTKKIKYTDEPMQTGDIVEDFLPRPEDLIFRKDRVLTLRLDEPTLDDLKRVAEKYLQPETANVAVVSNPAARAEIEKLDLEILTLQ